MLLPCFTLSHPPYNLLRYTMLHPVTPCYTLIHPCYTLLHPWYIVLHPVTPQPWCYNKIFVSMFFTVLFLHKIMNYTVHNLGWNVKCTKLSFQFQFTGLSFLFIYTRHISSPMIFNDLLYFLKRNRRKHYYFTCTDLPVCAILIDYSCVIARHD